MINFEHEKIFAERQQKEIIDKKIPFDQESFYHFKVKEIREREGRDRLNVDWPAEIYLKDKEGNILIDFKKDILPEGWRIISIPFEPGWHCDIGEKKILIPQSWNDSKEIISFLHEAGHAYSEHSLTDQEKISWSKVNSIWSEMNEIRKIFRAVQEKDYLEHLKEQYQKLEEQWQKENLDEGVKIAAKAERLAWTLAMKKTREIRKNKKIDLLKPFKNFKEVREYVQNRSLNVKEAEAFDKTEGRLRGYFSKENYPKPFKK